MAQFFTKMFWAFMDLFSHKKDAKVIDIVPIEPMKEIPSAVLPVDPPKPIIHSTAWCGGTIEERKAMFVLAKKICAEQGLSSEMTRDLLATVYGESGFNQWCENKNKDGTGDYGIAQLNSYWYLKRLKMTPQDAKDKPDVCLKIMARAFKQGRADDWIAHRNGSYLKYRDKIIV